MSWVNNNAHGIVYRSSAFFGEICIHRNITKKMLFYTSNSPCSNPGNISLGLATTLHKKPKWPACTTTEISCYLRACPSTAIWSICESKKLESSWERHQRVLSAFPLALAMLTLIFFRGNLKNLHSSHQNNIANTIENTERLGRLISTTPWFGGPAARWLGQYLHRPYFLLSSSMAWPI